MHHRLLVLPALGAWLLLVGAAAPQLRFAIDGAQSDVTARVAFFGLASKTAHFPRISGSIQLVPERPDAVTLDVALDAAALVASDATTTRRLKSPSFFDVARYPSVRFAGTRMQRTGAADAIVSGQLSAHGTTRPVTLAVHFSRPIAAIGAGDRVEIEARTTINRRDFGMTAYPLVVGRDVAIVIRAHMVPAS